MPLHTSCAKQDNVRFNKESDMAAYHCFNASCKREVSVNRVRFAHPTKTRGFQEPYCPVCVKLFDGLGIAFLTLSQFKKERALLTRCSQCFNKEADARIRFPEPTKTNGEEEPLCTKCVEKFQDCGVRFLTREQFAAEAPDLRSQVMALLNSSERPTTSRSKSEAKSEKSLRDEEIRERMKGLNPTPPKHGGGGTSKKVRAKRRARKRREARAG